MKILVFGNPLVEKDSLPLKLLPLLRKEFSEITFSEFDAAENLENQGKDLIILDAVEGIEKVTMIEDIDVIKNERKYSLHDFDLGMTLKLLKKMKKIDSVRILGIPVNYEEKKAFEELKKLIATLL